MENNRVNRPLETLVMHKDKVLLDELVALRTMENNHRAAMASQSNRVSIRDLYINNVPRERYDLLINLAIEALIKRLSA
jgi:hypothetical protein